MSALNLVIISGLSGSGKSHAIKCFEDAGYFCVDNLPPALLPVFADLCNQQGEDITKVALGIDLRERGFFGDLVSIIEKLKSRGYSVELVYLEASDKVLIRRFSESKRPHPIFPQFPVLQGVQRERERLQELRGKADQIIDTSSLSVHQLKDFLIRQYIETDRNSGVSLTLITFGFKFGVPYDIDMLFDVRFLRNPHFVLDLKDLTGEDARVRAYVMGDPNAEQFLLYLSNFLEFLLPQFERERRAYLTIALGCTGGRHRSVALAGELEEKLLKSGREVALVHRDLHKPT